MKNPKCKFKHSQTTFTGAKKKCAPWGLSTSDPFCRWTLATTTTPPPSARFTLARSLACQMGWGSSWLISNLHPLEWELGFRKGLCLVE